MFVKVNSFGDHTVLVTELQIDDLNQPNCWVNINSNYDVFGIDRLPNYFNS